MSLHQGFPHCAKFPTAASRRSLGRISVPVWLIILSDQLSVVALVGRYPTNKLMERGLIQGRKQAPFFTKTEVFMNVFGISSPFGGLSPTPGHIIHALLTRLPLSIGPKANFSFDLHVLSMPPAFVLSQDQTLHLGRQLSKILHTQASLSALDSFLLSTVKYAELTLCTITLSVV